jgi:hypothetical protein
MEKLNCEKKGTKRTIEHNSPEGRYFSWLNALASFLVQISKPFLHTMALKVDHYAYLRDPADIYGKFDDLGSEPKDFGGKLW